jgi:hypothetical protein
VGLITGLGMTLPAINPETGSAWVMAGAILWAGCFLVADAMVDVPA